MSETYKKCRESSPLKARMAIGNGGNGNARICGVILEAGKELVLPDQWSILDCIITIKPVRHLRFTKDWRSEGGGDMTDIVTSPYFGKPDEAMAYNDCLELIPEKKQPLSQK